MTDNAQSMQIEELVLLLHALIEQDQELLADNKAQAQANEQYAQQLSAQVKKLTELLKTYQDKEQLIIDNTNQALKNNINAAFQQNQKGYHALIDQGFTIHIDTATKQLSTVATKVEKQFEELETAATNSKTEFESRQKFFKTYEDTYDTQSRKMKESVNETMTQVLSGTKDKLGEVGSDFSYKLAKDLSWKVTTVFGTVCVLIMLLTFGSAWLFIPSKADIAERRANYEKLAAGRIAHNVIKGQDGEYYARIKPKSCFIGTDKYQYCRFK